MSEEKKSTKEALLIEALRLFAKNGYDAVSVAQIAKAVNVTPPALYKHYGGKRELFEAVLERSTEGYLQQMHRFHVDYERQPDILKESLTLSPEEHATKIKQLFLHTLHDEYPSLLRKLLMVEQFRMPELARVYNERYVTNQIKTFERFLEAAMEAGIVKKGNAKMLAMQYISPVILLIGVCDREPEREEWAIAMIEEHIISFHKMHFCPGDNI